MWNLIYDSVLGVELPPECSIMCYVDDTLIVAEARVLNEASRMATEAISRITAAIKKLDLTISASKTEVMEFRHLIYC